MKLKILTAIIISCVFVSLSYADCPLAHTHIGVNPTWRPDWSAPGDPALATDTDLTDDNKLWFFSLPPVHPAGTPDWPDWGNDPTNSSKPFLKLTPLLDEFMNPIYKPTDNSKTAYTCSFMYSKAGGYDPDHPDKVLHLDGWHSAHGPQGKWNLESVDQQTEPDWDLRLKREAISSNLLEDDFFMFIDATGESALITDGDEHILPKDWLADKNAWGFHQHMEFIFWLDENPGDIVSATFSVRDAGGLYQASDDFEIAFEVVPEPASLFLISAGILLIRKKFRNAR